MSSIKDAHALQKDVRIFKKFITISSEDSPQVRAMLYILMKKKKMTYVTNWQYICDLENRPLEINAGFKQKEFIKTIVEVGLCSVSKGQK